MTSVAPQLSSNKVSVYSASLYMDSCNVFYVSFVSCNVYICIYKIKYMHVRIYLRKKREVSVIGPIQNVYFSNFYFL